MKLFYNEYYDHAAAAYMSPVWRASVKGKPNGSRIQLVRHLNGCFLLALHPRIEPTILSVSWDIIHRCWKLKSLEKLIKILDQLKLFCIQTRRHNAKPMTTIICCYTWRTDFKWHFMVFPEGKILLQCDIKVALFNELENHTWFHSVTKIPSSCLVSYKNRYLHVQNQA